MAIVDAQRFFATRADADDVPIRLHTRRTDASGCPAMSGELLGRLEAALDEAPPVAGERFDALAAIGAAHDRMGQEYPLLAAVLDCHIDGRSPASIAEELGTTASAAKRLITRATARVMLTARRMGLQPSTVGAA